jgi:hypothetical protein
MPPTKATLLGHVVLGCLCAVAVAAAAAAGAAPAAPAADLTKIADPAVWRLHNRAAQVLDEGGKKYVRMDARGDHGVAWLVGSDFKEGTIEVRLRGRDDPGRSFVGIAFRGVDDATYDAVYFRAFNFRNADPERRRRAVQYVSWPGFTWQKLRAEHPGKYEQPIIPPPEPNGWFRARLVVEGGKVSVFVNDAATPALVVTELSGRRGGMVGLWVDNGSPGDFADLRLTPEQKRRR